MWDMPWRWGIEWTLQLSRTEMLRGQSTLGKDWMWRWKILSPQKDIEVDCENECESRRANVCGAVIDNSTLTVNNYNVWGCISCIRTAPLFCLHKNQIFLHFLICIFRNLPQNSEQREPADHLSQAVAQVTQQLLLPGGLDGQRRSSSWAGEQPTPQACSALGVHLPRSSPGPPGDRVTSCCWQNRGTWGGIPMCCPSPS